MATDPIRWKEWRDFSGGLWQRGNQREVPPNGLLELVDAYPVQAGGLRAAMAFSDEVTAGLLSTGAIALGLWVSPRPAEDFATPGRHIYIAQARYPAVAGGSIEMRFALSTAISTWTTVIGGAHTTVVGSNYVPIPFTNYFTTVSVAGVANLTADLYSINNTDNSLGVYAIDDVGNQTTRQTTAHPKVLAAHQDRLFGDNAFSLFTGQPRQSIVFSDPGGTTFTGFQAVGPYIPGADAPIMSMHPSYPSDLTVLRWPRGVFSVQGSFPSVLVREGAVNLTMAQKMWGVASPYGTVVPTANDGIWLYTGGVSASPLSAQIAGTPQFPPTSAAVIPSTASGWYGQLGYGNDYLFTPTGYAYDFRTRAWFQLSLPRGNTYGHWSYDPVNDQMFAAGMDSSNGIRVVSARLSEQFSTRASAYTFTVPVYDLPQDNRSEPHNVVLRELNYYLEAFNDGSQIQGEIVWERNGTSVSSPLPVVAMGRGLRNIRINVGAGPGAINSRWIKIRTTLRAPGGREAPKLDRMRLGFTEGSPYPG